MERKCIGKAKEAMSVKCVELNSALPSPVILAVRVETSKPRAEYKAQDEKVPLEIA